MPKPTIPAKPSKDTPIEIFDFSSYDTHIPVMLREVLDAIDAKDGEIIVDGTFGAGGYTRAILDHANCNVIGIDQDPVALSTGHDLAKNNTHFSMIEGNFANIDTLLNDRDIKQVDAIVLDIGVSSMQIDVAERGFSFMNDGPLDMRMSQNGLSAKDFINDAEEEEIANVIYKYGDERFSRRIAKRIMIERANAPIETTLQLANIVKNAVPYNRKQKRHPATRTFQALRIHVNDELGALEKALEASKTLLKTGGRLVLVTFHSLEDGIVKRFMRKESQVARKGSRYMPSLPTDDDNEPDPLFKLITRKATEVSKAEAEANPRARSAKLRYAIRTISPFNAESVS